MTNDQIQAEILPLLVDLQAARREAISEIRDSILPHLNGHWIIKTERLITDLAPSAAIVPVVLDELDHLSKFVAERVLIGTSWRTVLEDFGHAFEPIERMFRDDVATDFTNAQPALRRLKSSMHAILDFASASELAAQICVDDRMP